MTVGDVKRSGKSLELEISPLVQPERVRAAFVARFAEDSVHAIEFRGDAFEIVRRPPFRGFYDCVVEGEVVPLRDPDHTEGPYRSGGVPAGPIAGTIVRARARPAGAIRTAIPGALVGLLVVLIPLASTAMTGRLPTVDLRLLALAGLVVVVLTTGFGAILRAAGIADARALLGTIHDTAYSVARSG